MWPWNEERVLGHPETPFGRRPQAFHMQMQEDGDGISLASF
jgi:hypothetical protein